MGHRACTQRRAQTPALALSTRALQHWAQGWLAWAGQGPRRRGCAGAGGQPRLVVRMTPTVPPDPPVLLLSLPSCLCVCSLLQEILLVDTLLFLPRARPHCRAVPSPHPSHTAGVPTRLTSPPPWLSVARRQHVRRPGAPAQRPQQRTHAGVSAGRRSMGHRVGTACGAHGPRGVCALGIGGRVGKHPPAWLVRRNANCAGRMGARAQELACGRASLCRHAQHMLVRALGCCHCPSHHPHCPHRPRRPPRC